MCRFFDICNDEMGVWMHCIATRRRARRRRRVARREARATANVREAFSLNLSLSLFLLTSEGSPLEEPMDQQWMLVHRRPPSKSKQSRPTHKRRRSARDQSSHLRERFITPGVSSPWLQINRGAPPYIFNISPATLLKCRLRSHPCRSL